MNNTDLNMILELNGKFIEIYKAKEDMPDVKQSALFGIGTFATYLPKPTFSLYLGNITASILDQISMKNGAFEPENIVSTENAISTLGKLVYF